jgi:hypothetical protein
MKKERDIGDEQNGSYYGDAFLPAKGERRGADKHNRQKSYKGERKPGR